MAIAIQKSFEYWSIVASNACRDFWRCITGASFQKYSCVQTKHQAMRTNKPVAIAIKKSFEYWSLVVGNACRDCQRNITGALFQKYSYVWTKHQATTTNKPVAECRATVAKAAAIIDQELQDRRRIEGYSAHM